MRLAVLLVLFFCSGACGLIYQVLWLRLLALIFGVTAYAASTVLAAFMAGLALGSLLAPRLLARGWRPLRVFAVAEVLIAASALATPALLEASAALYQVLYPVAEHSLAVLTMARLLTGFVVLLVPTMLMGMTLPVLSASALVRGSAFGSRVSLLYAVNTAGAVVGAASTGFVLIGAIGISRSFLLGATLNVVVGVLALLLDRRIVDTGADAAAPARDVTASTLPHHVPSFATLGVVVAISGLSALALEVVWFRMLVQYLTATTYAFTAMLTMVLLGIAIGGAMAARWLRRTKDWTLRLAAIQLAAGVTALISAVFLGWSYHAGWRTSGEWQASAAAILPVAILMGLSFPLALRLSVVRASMDAATTVATHVGRLYAYNVLGAIAGALLGGFVVLPALGTRRALVALAALYGASALLLVWPHPRRRPALVMAGACAAVFVVLAAQVPDPFDAYARRYGRDMREIWREEGIQTAVSVHASTFRRTLYLDGLHQANDTPEMVRFHRLIGHLAMVLHPQPERALVIGLGGGATPGAVSRYPGSRVQVVELSPGVMRSARFFSHINYDLLEQPHVRLRLDDGRNFLRLSRERFDVITADIIQPLHAGAGNLYSREYFQLVRNALSEGGLAVQWIGHRPTPHYKLIMRTFLDVFPHVTLWADGQVMVASLQPLRVSPDLVDRKRQHPVTAAALDEIGLDSFEALMSLYTADGDAMRAFVGDGPVLSDDRPLLEYHRSLPADETPLDLAAMRGDPSTLVR